LITYETRSARNSAIRQVFRIPAIDLPPQTAT
jgi:hypothetical protein